MRHYLSLFDWLLWLACVGVQVLALGRSRRGQFRILPLLLVYLLSESAALGAVALFGNTQTYSATYYLAGIVESFLLAAVSVELCALLLPAYRTRVLTFGPLTVAGPVFLNAIALPPLHVESLLKLGSVSFAAALVLMLLCFAFESGATVDLKRLSYCYAGLLFLLAVAAETQLRLGVTGVRMAERTLDVFIARHLWPVAWIVGISLVAWALPRKNGSHNSLAAAAGE